MMTEGKKNIYPAMIVLLIGAFLIFSAWAAQRAAGLGSRVSDADYYSKGLKYTATQVEKRAAEALGWTVVSRFKGRNLEFYLRGRDGRGVAGALGILYLALPDRAENIHLRLNEVSPGLYHLNLADDILGTIQARLEFERHGVRLNRSLLLNL